MPVGLLAMAPSPVGPGRASWLAEEGVPPAGTQRVSVAVALPTWAQCCSSGSLLAPATSEKRYDALRDEALLTVHTEPGDESDKVTLRATPALLGPRSAHVDRALCVMADPPLADDPTGLANATVAHGRIVFVHRGRVPFTSKIRAAQNAGAAGVIIINSRDDPILVDSHVGPKMGRVETVDDGRT